MRIDFPLSGQPRFFFEMKPWFWLTACGAMATLAAASYFLEIPSRGNFVLPYADHEISVRIVRVRRISLPRRLKISGELRPQRVLDLLSRLAGKITEVRFKVGDFVHAGALIATVHADGLEQRIHEQEASVRTVGDELRARDTELAEAEKQLAVRRELLGRDLISRRDFEEVEHFAETNHAQVELARANLAQQKAVLFQLVSLRDLTRLVAPVNGQVSRVYVKPGSLIGKQGAVMTLLDTDRLRLIEEVPGEEAEGLRRGNVVEISSPELPGVTGQGKVTRLEPLSGGAPRRTVTEIILDNARNIFRPGMRVDAEIASDTRDELLLVPRAAIVFEKKRTTVFKVRAERALRQEISLGRELGDEVEVTAGLTDQDSVIVNYPSSLKPGARVRTGNS